MKKSLTNNSNHEAENKTIAGFTLVELMVAMVVVSIALAGVGVVFVNTTQSYTVQHELADMQQNLRTAMYLIKNDLRNSGRNGLMNGTVGITNVDRFNPDADDANGYPGITMTSLVDTDGDGEADSNSIRTISYQVMDADGDGIRELRRQVIDSWNPPVGAPSWDLVCDAIEDISFAYAFDVDNNLDLDRATAGSFSSIIWGVETDGVQGLDTNSDNVVDGDIDEQDDVNGDGWINTADGSLGTQVDLRDIRAVRIWLLARAERIDTKYVDTHTWVLGHKVLDMTLPANDNRAEFRHTLLVGTISLPNHQWRP